VNLVWQFPWGRIESVPATRPQRGNRAHCWHGATYQWWPAWPASYRTAFDAERLDTPVPATVKPPQMTAPEFFAAWTRAEAMAKWFDVPILAWVRRHSLTPPRLNGIEAFSENAGPAVVTLTAIWPAHQIVFTCACDADAIPL
jgi:hypothetical protein